MVSEFELLISIVDKGGLLQTYRQRNREKRHKREREREREIQTQSYSYFYLYGVFAIILRELNLKTLKLLALHTAQVLAGLSGM